MVQHTSCFGKTTLISLGAREEANTGIRYYGTLLFVFQVFLLLVGGIIGTIMGLIDNNASTSGVSIFCLIVGWIYLALYGLATIIPNYALLIRRFHDTGRTMVVPIILFGFSIVINVVPSIISAQLSDNNSLTGSIVVLIFYLAYLVLTVYQIVITCLDSQRNSNKYGLSPKYQDTKANSSAGISHENDINNQHNNLTQ